MSNENNIELEKVRKRRANREVETFKRQKLIEEEASRKENEKFKIWKAQEKSFYFKQALERSQIRLRDNRPEVIDYVALILHFNKINDSEEFLKSFPDIFELIKFLDKEKLESLFTDLGYYLENKEQHDEIQERFLQTFSSYVSNFIKYNFDDVQLNERIKSHTKEEIEKIFKDKTPDELISLKKKILTNLQNPNLPIDKIYWGKVLSLLSFKIEGIELENYINQFFGSKPSFVYYEQPVQPIIIPQIKLIDKKPKISYIQYEPKLTPIETKPKHTKIISQEEFNQVFERQLDYLKNGAVVANDEISKKLYVEEKHKLFDEGEEEYNKTISYDKPTISNYQLIKPKFYNKVQIGYEWNPYNELHYDTNNPPPKVVTGYKFNIFYPKLLNSKITPKFHVYKYQDDNKFNIIRFVGGLPYEDVVFKVVNKEWDCLDKFSFKNEFSDSVLRLWFQFRRYKYKR